MGYRPWSPSAFTTTLATGARPSLTSTGSRQYAGNSDHSSATLDLCTDASAAVLAGSADAASHRRARGRTRPWKDARRAFLRSVSEEACRRCGRSHARSSRTPPPAAVPEVVVAMPWSSTSSLPDRSTSSRKSSTPVPLATVAAAYSTDERAGPSFLVSPCSLSNEATSDLIHDPTASSTSDSRAPLASSNAPASSVTNRAYPPGSTAPHSPLYFTWRHSSMTATICGAASSATRRPSPPARTEDARRGAVSDTRRLNSAPHSDPSPSESQRWRTERSADGRSFVARTAVGDRFLSSSGPPEVMRTTQARRHRAYVAPTSPLEPPEEGRCCSRNASDRAANLASSSSPPFDPPPPLRLSPSESSTHDRRQLRHSLAESREMESPPMRTRQASPNLTRIRGSSAWGSPAERKRRTWFILPPAAPSFLLLDLPDAHSDRTAWQYSHRRSAAPLLLLRRLAYTSGSTPSSMESPDDDDDDDDTIISRPAANAAFRTLGLASWKSGTTVAWRARAASSSPTPAGAQSTSDVETSRTCRRSAFDPAAAPPPPPPPLPLFPGSPPGSAWASATNIRIVRTTFPNWCATSAPALFPWFAAWGSTRRSTSRSGKAVPSTSFDADSGSALPDDRDSRRDWTEDRAARDATNSSPGDASPPSPSPAAGADPPPRRRSRHVSASAAATAARRADRGSADVEPRPSRREAYASAAAGGRRAGTRRSGAPPEEGPRVSDPRGRDDAQDDDEAAERTVPDPRAIVLLLVCPYCRKIVKTFARGVTCRLLLWYFVRPLLRAYLVGS